MLRLAADENFDNDILKELLRQRPELDIIRVQDAGHSGANDPTVLEWASQQERILLTHDKRTMPKFAYDRLREGLPMPGVLLVSREPSIGDIVEDILIQIEATPSDEWQGQVRYVPIT
jgi:predicted nuclease of predicted toxin-antitoxin system